MKKQRGFTVAELLIALAILIIVGAMVAIIFSSTQRSFINAKAFQHIINLARQTVSRVHNEIKATYIDTSGIINFVGVDASGTPIKAASAGDEVFFIMPDRGSAGGDICEIGYWQRNDGNFMRHFECPPDFNFASAGEDSELGLIISELDFEYYDGAVFIDSWDSREGGAQEGVFPQSVRFSFTVSDEDSLIRKHFGSQVRIASSAR